MVLLEARADGVSENMYLITPFQKMMHGLIYANVCFQSADHDLLYIARQAVGESYRPACAESGFFQDGIFIGKREEDFLHGTAQSFGILFGNYDRAVQHRKSPNGDRSLCNHFRKVE